MRWPQCPRSCCSLQEEGRKRDGTGGGDGTAEPRTHTHTGKARNVSHGTESSVCKGPEAHMPHVRSRERLTEAQRRWLRVWALSQQDKQQKHNVNRQRETEWAVSRTEPQLRYAAEHIRHERARESDTQTRRERERDKTHHHISLSIMTSI